MATSNTRNTQNATTPDLEAASERIREANERIVAAGSKVTIAYLDGVERYVAGVTQAQRKLGEQSQNEAIAQMFNAHAKLTEDVVKATVAATRELIPA